MMRKLTVHMRIWALALCVAATQALSSHSRLSAVKNHGPIRILDGHDVDILAGHEDEDVTSAQDKEETSDPQHDSSTPESMSYSTPVAGDPHDSSTSEESKEADPLASSVSLALAATSTVKHGEEDVQTTDTPTTTEPPPKSSTVKHGEDGAQTADTPAADTPTSDNLLWSKQTTDRLSAGSKAADPAQRSGPRSKVLVMQIDDRPLNFTLQTPDCLYNGTKDGHWKKYCGGKMGVDWDFKALSAIVNRHAATVNGFDYQWMKAEKGFLPWNRHPPWAKVKALNKTLPDYELIIFLDSDAWIRKPAKLADLVAKVEGQKLCLLCEDPQDENNTKYNTGFMILRNHPDTFRMLEEWWQVPDAHPEYHKHHYQWPWEQGSFDKIIYPKWADRIAPGSVEECNSPSGDVVRHAWVKNTRVEELKDQALALLTEQHSKNIQPLLVTHLLDTGEFKVDEPMVWK